MLGWLFKKSPSPAPRVPVNKPVAQAPKPALPVVDWPAGLQAALGDDEALLRLAGQGAAPVEVKLAAVDALSGEAVLKRAERELRDHDRRVHRHTKQRLLAAVAQREATEHATRLIDEAAALAHEPLIPSNRLVALDRAWQALDLARLDAALSTAFAARMAQLTTLTRERGDKALQAQRWLADAQQTLARVQALCAEAAAGTLAPRPSLAEAAVALQTLCDAAPREADELPVDLMAALQAAPSLCAGLDERLALLDECLAAQTDSDVLAQRWQQLPALADAALARVLDQRFGQWQTARQQAHQAQKAQRREQAKSQQRAVRGELAEALEHALAQGEAALAEGRLAEANPSLVEIDELLHAGAPLGELAARIDALQAEYARLKGWQHWGGGLARDELVLQAEALAQATQSPLAPIHIKQQADAINDMRARWKELDRLGGASSRALWQRFDAALKQAYEPVAAHVATQRATREQNLAARHALLEGLNALALPIDAAEADADWRALAIALDQFQAEWRKLGPVVHTVPHKEREALLQRMEAAVARVEQPLAQARQVAQRQREQLIERAKALGASAGRELGARSRELQAEWQQQAKALPLTRALENTLWADFKAAIDAHFAARDAAFNAREAEFQAFAAERLALIERLEALPAQPPGPDLKRALHEVDAQWQRVGPAPRAEAAALEARYRAAAEAVRQTLAQAAQQAWHAHCDGLAAQLQAAAQSEHANAAAVDEQLLQLEMLSALESPPEHQAARREAKLQAMKAALEGRMPVTPLNAKPLINALLGQALGPAQRARLAAVIAAWRAGEPRYTL